MDVGRNAGPACTRRPAIFQYCLYCCRPAEEADDRRTWWAVHGTERGNQAMRDLSPTCRSVQPGIILAPLFPCGVEEPYDRGQLKYIEYRGIPLRPGSLLSMID